MPLPRVFLPVAALAALSTAALAQPAPQVPGFTAAQAKRGAAFYSGSCALCHGDRLDDGEFAPPLKGPPHLAYWSGKTASDLFNYMSAMMPPTSPGSLGGQAYADLMAYLLQAAGATPGDKELSADPAALRAYAPTR